MNHETNYHNNNNCNHNNDINNEYNYNNHIENNNNDNNNENNNNENIEMKEMDSWRFRTLYTDTKYVCAAKRDEVLTSDKLYALQNTPQTHPSSVPVILKDSTRPYTYYTMKSYGPAQDNNYYVNFDDHVNANTATTGSGSRYNEYNYNSGSTATVSTTSCTSCTSCGDSECVKMLCCIIGCFACCLFHVKPV